MPRLYRIIRAARAEVLDFYSNRRLGKPPRGPEMNDPDMHDGVSMYDTAARARTRAIKYGLGKWVAAVDLPDGDPRIRISKTPGPGHYTVNADAALLVQFVEYPVIEV